MNSIARQRISCSKVVVVENLPVAVALVGVSTGPYVAMVRPGTSREQLRAVLGVAA